MATAIKMPRLSKVATTGEILEWLKSPGEPVQKGEPLFKALSEKATIEVESPAAGVLLQIVVPAGTEVSAGAVLGWIGAPGETVETVKEPPPVEGPAARKITRTPALEKKPGGAVRAVPAARRLAREYGISLETMTGTGPNGIITRADVEHSTRAGQFVETADTAGPAASPELAPDVELWPLSGIQRVMARRMSLNRDQVAQATTVAEVDMTEIVVIRDAAPATFTAWVVLAAVRALAEYPILNASLQDGQIAYHSRVHVGVSVETDAGLMVPVIHDAQAMGLSQVQKELARLVELAREGALSAEDVEGATFTVTNSGVLGSVWYTPMITPPQGAILGMGRVAKKPAVRDDQIMIRSMMYLCLSYDHRFIAGGTAVRYLQRVRRYLEHPLSLVWG